jgi:signal peptidase I
MSIEKDRCVTSIASVAEVVFDLWKDIGKETRIKISGQSMHPLITDGAAVLIKHTTEGIAPGAIIAYQRDSLIVVHRVIKIKKEKDKKVFITKGDFNRHLDPPVGEDEVLGKVVEIQKEERTIDLNKRFWRLFGYAIAAWFYLAGAVYMKLRGVKTWMGEKISAEHRLLLLCARVEMGPAEAEEIKSLVRQGLDWNYIVQKASWHQMAPLLYNSLKSMPRDVPIPTEAMNALESVYFQHACHNLRVWGHLSRALKYLQEANVKVIVCKGAALAEAVYRNLALRPMGDVDLLLHAQDEARRDEIYQALEEMGIYPDTEFEIDVHPPDITDMGIYKIDLDDIWQHAVPAKIAGVDALVMAPEHLIVSLCVNCLRHGFYPFKFFCDFSETVRFYHGVMDWDRVVAIAKRNNVTGPLSISLALAKDLFNCPAPPAVIRQLGTRTIRTKITRWLLIKQLSSQQHGRMKFGLIKPLSRTLLKYVVKDGTVLIRQIVRLLVPSKTFIRQRYGCQHPHTLHFYYLIHPLILSGLTIKVALDFLGSTINSISRKNQKHYKQGADTAIGRNEHV